MPSNLQTILDYLRNQLGLTPAQAAGVAGNLQVESGFNPAASNPREGAIGIAQWEGGRRTRLQQYAAAHGGSETDLMTQLGFMGDELRGSESGAFGHLTSTADAASAAAAFDQYYERSSGAARGTRIADAIAIAAGLPIGTSTTTGAGSGSSGGSSGGSGQSVASQMGGWGGTAFTIGLKVMGAGTAAALVVVGAVHTIK